jgi:hypothetical protein
MNRCSICHTLIQPTEETTDCTACQQDYHDACWKDLGGCATYGCSGAAPTEKPAPPAVTAGGWGDVKQCPACGATIGTSLLLCRCGARFPSADPMSPDVYEGWKRRQQEVLKSKILLSVLFVLSLSGVPAPVLGPVAGVVAFRRRDKLAGRHGTYLAMGYGAAALGGVYALVLALLWMGF